MPAHVCTVRRQYVVCTYARLTWLTCGAVPTARKNATPSRQAQGTPQRCTCSTASPCTIRVSACRLYRVQTGREGVRTACACAHLRMCTLRGVVTSDNASSPILHLLLWSRLQMRTSSARYTRNKCCRQRAKVTRWQRCGDTLPGKFLSSHPCGNPGTKRGPAVDSSRIHMRSSWYAIAQTLVSHQTLLDDRLVLASQRYLCGQHGQTDLEQARLLQQLCARAQGAARKEHEVNAPARAHAKRKRPTARCALAFVWWRGRRMRHSADSHVCWHAVQTGTNWWRGRHTRHSADSHVCWHAVQNGAWISGPVLRCTAPVCTRVFFSPLLARRAFACSDSNSVYRFHERVSRDPDCDTSTAYSCAHHVVSLLVYQLRAIFVSRNVLRTACIVHRCIAAASLHRCIAASLHRAPKWLASLLALLPEVWGERALTTKLEPTGGVVSRTEAMFSTRLLHIGFCGTMRGVKHESVRFPCIRRDNTHIRSRKTPKASSSKYQETGYVSMRGRGRHLRKGKLVCARLDLRCMVRAVPVTTCGRTFVGVRVNTPPHRSY